MKLFRYTQPVYSCLFFLLLGFFFASPLQGAQFEENVSTETYLFAQGILQSVSLEEQTVSIKQKKGPTISLSVENDTLFEGFYKLKELKLRDKLKVWYQPGQQNNKALKILKPLELGC